MNDTIEAKETTETIIEVIESKVDLTKDELLELRRSRDQLMVTLGQATAQRNQIDNNIKQLNSLLSGLTKIFRVK